MYFYGYLYKLVIIGLFAVRKYDRIGYFGEEEKLDSIY